MNMSFLKGLCIVCFLLLFFGCESTLGKRDTIVCPIGHRCQQIKVEDRRRADANEQIRQEGNQQDHQKIVVKTFVTLTSLKNESTNAEHLFLTSEGADIAYDNGEKDSKDIVFKKILPLTAKHLQAEKINILLSAPHPTIALVSLTSKEKSKSEVLGTGMVHLDELMGDGSIIINDITSLSLKIAEGKFPNLNDLRCLIEPYHRIRELLQHKIREVVNLQMAVKENAEISRGIQEILNSSTCRPLPFEKKQGFSTLAMNLTNLKLSAGRNFKLRIRREDGRYLPIILENASAILPFSNYQVAFKAPQEKGEFILKIKTLDLEGPPFGTIEIMDQDAVMISAGIDFKQAFSGEVVVLGPNNISDFPQSETVKFIIAHPQSEATYLLQDQNQLFIPIKMNQASGEIELSYEHSHGWGKLVSIEKQNVSQKALLNLSSVASRHRGLVVSILGNTLLGLLIENKKLTDFNSECLYAHFRDFGRILSEQNKGHENDASLRLDQEMQHRLIQFKQEQVCKKNDNQPRGI